MGISEAWMSRLQWSPMTYPFILTSKAYLRQCFCAKAAGLEQIEGLDSESGFGLLPFRGYST
ncbi:hypothetical protein Csa_010863 [Cucumis sativus]|uniref:Uncharacterized protein n=1 Tax=Cucumis sativus TaxID=3659 RepID=A0A0A0L7J7_CUCSA|nr:hypothetical protein Csa_010863 [Cucumis sativus]